MRIEEFAQEAHNQIHTVPPTPGLGAVIARAGAVSAGGVYTTDLFGTTETPWTEAKANAGKRIAQRGKSSVNGTILVLSPMRDRGHALGRFFDMLVGLTYPKHLISVAILEGDSKDDTFLLARRKLYTLVERHGFRRAVLIKRDFAFKVDRGHRHEYHVQQERRATLSRLRNYLSTTALYDEDWVMWVDSDLAWYPPDILELMLATKKDLVVPHCLLGANTYDFNSWQETTKSWELQESLSPEEVLYEGYVEEAGLDTHRLHMSELQYRCGDPLREESRAPLRDEVAMAHLCPESGVVKLDGIGGAIILLRAKLHREGVYNPRGISVPTDNPALT
eukprot:SAG25_NODE_48_length_18937_cov_1106.642637_14_plen_335_part_00